MLAEYPSKLDVRIYRSMTTAMFALVELVAFLHAYKITQHAVDPFSYIAYLLPFLVACPWFAAHAIRRHIELSWQPMNDRAPAVMEMRIQAGLVMSYSLFLFCIVFPTLSKAS